MRSLLILALLCCILATANSVCLICNKCTKCSPDLKGDMFVDKVSQYVALNPITERETLVSIEAAVQMEIRTYTFNYQSLLAITVTYDPKNGEASISKITRQNSIVDTSVDCIKLSQAFISQFSAYGLLTLLNCHRSATTVQFFYSVDESAMITITAKLGANGAYTVLSESRSSMTTDNYAPKSSDELLSRDRILVGSYVDITTDIYQRATIKAIAAFLQSSLKFPVQLIQLVRVERQLTNGFNYRMLYRVATFEVPEREVLYEIIVFSQFGSSNYKILRAQFYNLPQQILLKNLSQGEAQADGYLVDIIYQIMTLYGRYISDCVVITKVERSVPFYAITYTNGVGDVGFLSVAYDPVIDLLTVFSTNLLLVGSKSKPAGCTGSYTISIANSTPAVITDVEQEIKDFNNDPNVKQVIVDLNKQFGAAWNMVTVKYVWAKTSAWSVRYRIEVELAVKGSDHKVSYEYIVEVYSDKTRPMTILKAAYIKLPLLPQLSSYDYANDAYITTIVQKLAPVFRDYMIPNWRLLSAIKYEPFYQLTFTGYDETSLIIQLIYDYLSGTNFIHRAYILYNNNTIDYVTIEANKPVSAVKVPVVPSTPQPPVPEQIVPIVIDTKTRLINWLLATYGNPMKQLTYVSMRTDGTTGVTVTKYTLVFRMTFYNSPISDVTLEIQLSEDSATNTITLLSQNFVGLRSDRQLYKFDWNNERYVSIIDYGLDELFSTDEVQNMLPHGWNTVGVVRGEPIFITKIDVGSGIFLYFKVAIFLLTRKIIFLDFYATGGQWDFSRIFTLVSFPGTPVGNLQAQFNAAINLPVASVAPSGGSSFISGGGSYVAPSIAYKSINPPIFVKYSYTILSRTGFEVMANYQSNQMYYLAVNYVSSTYGVRFRYVSVVNAYSMKDGAATLVLIVMSVNSVLFPLQYGVIVRIPNSMSGSDLSLVSQGYFNLPSISGAYRTSIAIDPFLKSISDRILTAEMLSLGQNAQLTEMSVKLPFYFLQYTANDRVTYIQVVYDVLTNNNIVLYQLTFGKDTTPTDADQLAVLRMFEQVIRDRSSATLPSDFITMTSSSGPNGDRGISFSIDSSSFTLSGAEGGFSKVDQGSISSVTSLVVSGQSSSSQSTAPTSIYSEAYATISLTGFSEISPFVGNAKVEAAATFVRGLVGAKISRLTLTRALRSPSSDNLLALVYKVAPMYKAKHTVYYAFQVSIAQDNTVTLLRQSYIELPSAEVLYTVVSAMDSVTTTVDENIKRILGTKLGSNPTIAVIASKQPYVKMIYTSDSRIVSTISLYDEIKGEAFLMDASSSPIIRPSDSSLNQGEALSSLLSEFDVSIGILPGNYQQDPNCVKYLEGVCIECEPSYILASGSCVDACLVHNVSEAICTSCVAGYFSNTRGSCSPLPSGCLTANPDGTCTVCAAGRSINLGQCV